MNPARAKIKIKNPTNQIQAILSTRVNPTSSTLIFSTTTSLFLLPHLAVLFPALFPPTLLFPILPSPLPLSFTDNNRFRRPKISNSTGKLSAADFRCPQQSPSELSSLNSVAVETGRKQFEFSTRS